MMNSYKVSFGHLKSYDVIVEAYTDDEAAIKALAIPASEWPEPSYDNVAVSWIESNDK